MEVHFAIRVKTDIIQRMAIGAAALPVLLSNLRILNIISQAAVLFAASQILLMKQEIHIKWMDASHVTQIRDLYPRAAIGVPLTALDTFSAPTNQPPTQNILDLQLLALHYVRGHAILHFEKTQLELHVTHARRLLDLTRSSIII